MKNNRFTFEELFKKNECRTNYHLHRINIHDPHQESFQEGLIAMWNAYNYYQPDQGPLSTYFNIIIRQRLIEQSQKIENK